MELKLHAGNNRHNIIQTVSVGNIVCESVLHSDELSFVVGYFSGRRALQKERTTQKQIQ
jgi:hypothetical protein